MPPGAWRILCRSTDVDSGAVIRHYLCPSNTGTEGWLSIVIAVAHGVVDWPVLRASSLLMNHPPFPDMLSRPCGAPRWRLAGAVVKEHHLAWRCRGALPIWSATIEGKNVLDAARVQHFCAAPVQQPLQVIFAGWPMLLPLPASLPPPTPCTWILPARKRRQGQARGRGQGPLNSGSVRRYNHAHRIHQGADTGLAMVAAAQGGDDRLCRRTGGLMRPHRSRGCE